MIEYLQLLPVALVATIASFILMSLWYNLLFAREWQYYAGSGFASRKTIISGFLVTFVSACVITLIFAGLDFLGAIFTVILLWLGFTAMPFLSRVIWEEQPAGLFAINVGYELLSVVLMASLVVLLI